MPSAEELLDIADRLYALEPGEFTAARDAAVKEHRGDKELAAAIKKLKKPSLAAWAVNVLVRREDEQIGEVLGLGESLRAAAESLDGEELRALTRQRRQLTAALTSTARTLAREYGLRLTPAVSDQVDGVLNAALLDPVAAEVVRSGLVLSAFTSTGVSEVDVPAVCAVPEAVGSWIARPTEAPETPEDHAPPRLKVVPDTAVRLEAARERVEEAAAALTQATAELDEAESSLKDLQARRLQLGQEMDELQRRLAELEESVDEVEEDIEEAETARNDAGAAARTARAEQEAAEAEVTRLEQKAATERQDS